MKTPYDTLFKNYIQKNSLLRTRAVLFLNIGGPGIHHLMPVHNPDYFKNQESEFRLPEIRNS